MFSRFRCGSAAGHRHLDDASAPDPVMRYNTSGDGGPFEREPGAARRRPRRWTATLSEDSVIQTKAPAGRTEGQTEIPDRRAYRET